LLIPKAVLYELALEINTLLVLKSAATIELRNGFNV